MSLEVERQSPNCWSWTVAGRLWIDNYEKNRINLWDLSPWRVSLLEFHEFGCSERWYWGVPGTKCNLWI